MVSCAQNAYLPTMPDDQFPEVRTALSGIYYRKHDDRTMLCNLNQSSLQNAQEDIRTL